MSIRPWWGSPLPTRIDHKTPSAAEDRIRDLEAQLEAQNRTIQALIEYQEASKQQMPAFLQNIGLHRLVARKTEALKSSERFLETIIDTLDSEICILDSKGALLKVNHSWEKGDAPHLGSPPWREQNYLELCRQLSLDNPDFPQDAAAALEAVLKNELPHYQAVYSEMSAGKRHWFEMRAIPLLDVRLGSLLILHRDITELIEVQKELKDREAYFRAITEGANDPIIMADEEGAILHFNQAASRAFGYQREEALGKGLQELVPSLQRSRLPQCKESQAVVGKKKCGKAFPLRLSLSRLRLSTGQVHYSCIFHDLTEIQQMEQDLAQARKLESIGQLAAGIAHEINTPLQYVADNFAFVEETCDTLLGILSRFNDSPQACEEFIQALQDAEFGYLTEEVPEALRQSMEGLGRITNIVAAMRDFSHTSCKKTLADLNAGIESTITVTRNEWKYVATLETQLAPELGPVSCYLSDIKQVVLNLIVNASHAIAERQRGDRSHLGHILVKTEKLSNGVRVSVRDNGSGIPEELRHCIFDPFFTTKEVGVGTGQGLSIARRIIVDKHQGELQFECPPEGGTTFFFTLPSESEPGAL